MDPARNHPISPRSERPSKREMLLYFCPALAVQAVANVKVLTISTPHNIVDRGNKRSTNDQTAVFEICRTVVIND